MKRIVLIFGVFIILSANLVKAEEPGSTKSRSISDLMYFPYANTVFIMPSYAVGFGSEKLSYSSNTVADKEFFLSACRLIAGYGITDNIYFAVYEIYTFENKEEYKYGSGSTKNGQTDEYKMKGFTDPYFSLGFRPLEQGENPYTVDVTVYYSPKIISAESASPSKDGNQGRGDHFFNVELGIGKKFSEYELHGMLSFEYNTKREIKDLEDDHDMEVEGGEELELGFIYQRNLTDNLYLNFGINIGYIFEKKVNDTNTSEKQTDDAHLEVDLMAGLSYKLFSENVLLHLAYYYNTASDYSVSSGGVSLDYSEQGLHSFQIDILMQI